MAEAIISPGVFLNENDLSQIQQGPVVAGAALVGPTVKGPVNRPTVITSYTDFTSKFGTIFTTGSSTEEYLTSLAAYNYFQQGGETLIVTRVVSGSTEEDPNGAYAPATASIASKGLSASGGAFATASFDVTNNITGSMSDWRVLELKTGDTAGDAAYFIQPYPYFAVNTNWYDSTFNILYVGTQNATIDQWGAAVRDAINQETTEIGTLFSASYDSSTNLLAISASTQGYFPNSVYSITYSGSYVGDTSGVTKLYFANGIDPVYGESFVIETLAVGDLQNNDDGAGTSTNGFLPSGSINNVRWEIANSDDNSGLFTLVVRRGDDYQQTKTVLETWSNLSLDPNTANYIEYQIGNMSFTPVQDENGDWQLQQSGSYANKSRYIRVKSVAAQPNYFNNDGTVNPTAADAMPAVGSGSLNGAFGGADGDLFGGASTPTKLLLFENITGVAEGSTNAVNNIQGLVAGDYAVAFSLLKNKDFFDYQVIYAPGLSLQNSYNTLSDLIDVVEYRGDAVAVVDTTVYNGTTTAAVTQAATVDTSYAATYWPWVQVRSNETGKLRFIPASTIIPGVYAYNDKIAAEWFAPAGLTRGGLTTVIGPEFRLTKANRDTLYQGKVNPIAIFPGSGTVIYGQKTLQTRPSALDRVNVRRLLIELKRVIGGIAENFVFEQNTVATRTKFINQVTPYLDSVQQRQGLFSYRVVMDETNNTPEVIDRNQLVGAIYLQPTRTAEFIILDFNILPTGATFGQ